MIYYIMTAKKWTPYPLHGYNGRSKYLGTKKLSKLRSTGVTEDPDRHRKIIELAN